MSDVAASAVRDTFYALVACYLATGSQDIVAQWANVPRDASGVRTFEFSGKSYQIARKATNDLFSYPGVNVYFGDDIVYPAKAQPRKWALPVIIHVLVPWVTPSAVVSEKLSMRIADTVMQATEGLGGRVQVCDFTSGSPVPVANRYVSWAVAPEPKWVWREQSQPYKDTHTNRMASIELRYAR